MSDKIAAPIKSKSKRVKFPPPGWTVRIVESSTPMTDGEIGDRAMQLHRALYEMGGANK